MTNTCTIYSGFQCQLLTVGRTHQQTKHTTNDCSSGGLMTGKSGRILANGVEHHLSTFGVTFSGSYLGMLAYRTSCTSCAFRRQRTLPGRKRQHHVSAQSRDSHDVSPLRSHAHRTLYRRSRRSEQSGLFQRRAGGNGSTVFRPTALYVSRRRLCSSDAVSARFCVIPGDFIELSAG